MVGIGGIVARIRVVFLCIVILALSVLNSPYSKYPGDSIIVYLVDK